MEWNEFYNYGIIGILIAFGTLIATFQKIAKNFNNSRDAHSEKILQAAKEANAVITSGLEARIDQMDIEIKNLESNVNKDLAHIKESYKSELKNLGSKIEDLRSDLSSQHSSLLSLLTKLVDKK